jgi:hypothetical protein
MWFERKIPRTNRYQLRGSTYDPVAGNVGYPIRWGCMLDLITYTEELCNELVESKQFLYKYLLDISIKPGPIDYTNGPINPTNKE